MHEGLMSESNNSRTEAEECLRKANSCDDNQDKIGLARFGRKLAATGGDQRHRREQEEYRSQQ